MKTLVTLTLAALLLAPAVLDAQACRGFSTQGTNMAPTMVRGDWAGSAGVTFDAYGGVVSRSVGEKYNGGVSFFSGTATLGDGTEPGAWGAETVLSRSMVETYLNQQVVCVNLGVAAQDLDVDDVQLAVPASLSFGIELDGGWFSLTPHGLAGARFVIDDGVDPRLDVGFGMTVRMGPVTTGASVVKQGNRDQQRGILHAGLRF